MFKHTAPVTVYGYVRVSGAGQADKDGPIRQQTAIKDFCKQHALGGVAFYSDLGISGTTEGLHRPAFIDMVSDSEASGVKVVVVERMDRLARDLMVSEMLLRELRSRSIVLYSTDQGLSDLVTTDSDPSRKLIRQMFAAMAEFEKSCLVLKLRAARERKRKVEGKCEGTEPFESTPYGRDVIELVIRLRADGASWRGIAEMLTRDKLKKFNGVTHTWTGDEVFKVMKRFEARRNRKCP